MARLLFGPRAVMAFSAMAMLCAVEGSRSLTNCAGMGVSVAPGASIIASRTRLAGRMGSIGDGAMHIRGGAGGKAKKGLDDEYSVRKYSCALSSRFFL